MAKKRKSNSSATASLDSFLDTLFNVAGILVIIIALAQITARETIKDVNTGKKSQGGIDAEMLAKKQRELEQTTRKRNGKEAQFNNLRSKVSQHGRQLREKNNEAKEKKRALNLDGEFIPISDLNALLETALTRAKDLNATWIDLSNTYTNILAVKDSETILAQLKQATEDRDSNQTALADAEKQSQENQAKLAKAKKDLVTAKLAQAIAALKRKLSDSKARQKTNQARLDAWQIQLDDLEAQLAQAEFKARPMVVPVPRKPPDLATVTFWVRHNRIIVSEGAIRLKARGIKENAHIRFPHIVTNDDFKLDLSAFPDFIKISWRQKTVGETGPKLIKPNSEYRKIISGIARRKDKWIRFIVWADSFEAYRLARAVVDQENENLLKNHRQGAALLKEVASGKLTREEAWEKFDGFKLEAGWKPLAPDVEIGFVRQSGFDTPPD